MHLNDLVYPALEPLDPSQADYSERLDKRLDEYLEMLADYERFGMERYNRLAQSSQDRLRAIPGVVLVDKHPIQIVSGSGAVSRECYELRYPAGDISAKRLIEDEFERFGNETNDLGREYLSKERVLKRAVEDITTDILRQTRIERLNDFDPRRNQVQIYIVLPDGVYESSLDITKEGVQHPPVLNPSLSREKFLMPQWTDVLKNFPVQVNVYRAVNPSRHVDAEDIYFQVMQDYSVFLKKAEERDRRAREELDTSGSLMDIVMARAHE